MFAVVLTFLSTNIGSVFTLIGDVVSGPIPVFYDSVGGALTDVGELTLLGAIIGLGWFGLRWVLKLIPFARG